MAYPYYANSQYYMQNMQDLQNMRDKIDRQMQQVQQMNQNQMQPQMPTNGYMKMDILIKMKMKYLIMKICAN